MPILKKLERFLTKNRVKFETVSHRTVYTALDKAATLRVKPNLIAKTLVLRAGKNLVMAVLAANRNLDKKKFRKAAKVKNFDFVSERLMKTKFKGFKIGAIPPFGSMFKMPSFVDRGLLKEKAVYISAGNYEISLKLSPKVFEKLGAIKADISVVKEIAKPKKKKNK
jgi:Ala-tRNA(Pro) deacylase